MFINVPEDVAKRLEKLAEQEGSTVGDVLESLLNRYVPDALSRTTLAELAQNAKEADINSDQ